MPNERKPWSSAAWILRTPARFLPISMRKANDREKTFYARYLD